MLNFRFSINSNQADIEKKLREQGEKVKENESFCESIHKDIYNNITKMKTKVLGIVSKHLTIAPGVAHTIEEGGK